MNKKSEIPPELQEEILRISDLFESTRINYQVVDASGHISYVNQPWIDTMGYQRDKALGMPFMDIMSEASRETYLRGIQDCECMEAGEALELVLLCADHSKITASFSCFCNPGENGLDKRFHCTFQNITRLRQTEKALQLSEARYERIFNSFRDVYYQADPDSQIILISPSIRKLGAYEPADLIGKNVASFFESEEIRSAFRTELIGKGFVDDYDLKLKHKNGTFMDVSISAQIVRDPQGDPDFVEGVIRDISRRKIFESHIATYNNRFREITLNLPVILFQVIQRNTRFSIEFISPNIHEWLGNSAEAISANPDLLFPFLTKETRRKVIAEFSRAFKEKSHAELEINSLNRHGFNRPLRIRASFRVDQDKGICWTGVFLDITREVEDRETIQEQEKRLQTLYHYTKIGIGNMSLQGITTSVNKAILDATGYSREDFEGSHFTRHPQYLKKDMPGFLKLFRNALTGNVPEEGVVFQYLTKKGDLKWAEALLSLHRREGKIIGFQGLFIDITDRILKEKSREFNLWASDFLFKSAEGFLKVQNEDELYGFLDQQLRELIPGAIINLNAVSDDLSLLEVKSVSGLSGAIRSRLVKVLGSTLKGRTFEITPQTFSYAKEGKLIRAHKKLYDLALHQIPESVCEQMETLIKLREIHEISLGVDNDIMGGCAIFVCDKQRIEHPELVENLFRTATGALTRLKVDRQLRQREELYRSLAENTKDIIVRVDSEGKIIYINPAFSEAFRVNMGEVLHKSFQSIGLPEANGDLIHSLILDTLDSGEAQTCDQIISVKGQAYFYEWRSFPERNHSNGIKGVLIFAYDISARKEMEARLLEGVENKNNIFRLMGHDLSSPFNTILGFVNLLDERYDQLDDKERLKYIRHIRDSSRNLNNLLLTLRQWTRENECINVLHFDARQALESNLEILRPLILEKNLHVDNSLPEGILMQADYNMVSAAFRNLLANAIKYSFPEGNIHITYSSESDRAIFRIKDHGVGMNTEEIKQLLDPKQEFSREGTGGEKGTGYGFRMAMEFIQRNQGSIRIESEKGNGTLVQIELPNSRSARLNHLC